MNTKPLLLDLFSGAGGAAKGYHDAGFAVVGVDIAPQPRYPYEWYQADALAVLDTLLGGERWQSYALRDFAGIHASPECQGYSRTRFMRNARPEEHPKLIREVRARLVTSRLPWVIENVEGSDLPDAVELCGSMFGLPIRRHRWFASSILLFAPGPCKHIPGFYNPVGGKVRGYGTLASKTTFQDAKGATRRREGSYKLVVGRQALGVDWLMSLNELSQAIPPAYTHWIGQQLITAIMADCEIA